jgi:cytochrome c-type biogenesis protein
MDDQERIFLNAVLFVLGFSLVFSLVGVLFQTVLAHAQHSVMEILSEIGGALIIGFGILMIASSRYVIPFFSAEHRIRTKRTGNSYISSFVFGLAFAIGWTPCVGAILGSIYIFAAASPGLGFLLLLAYSIGLGVPFLIFGAFISKLSGFMRRIRRFLNYFNIIGGLFLVAMGLLVISGYIGELSVFLIGNAAPMAAGDSLNFLIALVAGVVTFLSPCILPLMPAYFAYMAGTASVVSG